MTVVLLLIICGCISKSKSLKHAMVNGNLNFDFYVEPKLKEIRKLIKVPHCAKYVTSHELKQYFQIIFPYLSHNRPSWYVLVIPHTNLRLTYVYNSKT